MANQQDIEKQTRHLQLLNEITRIALESQNVKEMLNRLASCFVESFSATGCAIFLWDSEEGRLSPAAACGEAADAFLASRIEAGELASGLQAIEQGQVVINQPGGSLSRRPASSPERVLSYLNLPLVAGQQKIGLVILSYSPAQASFAAEDLAAWQEIASQISLASLKTILLEQEQQRRQEAENLRMSVSLLSATLNINQVINNILTYLSRIATFDTAFIALIEGERIQTAAGIGSANPGKSVELAAGVGSSFYPLLKDTAHPVIFGDIHQHPAFPHLRQETGPALDTLRGWMGVPLNAFGNPVGFLLLGSRQVNAFHEADTRRVGAFARQASVAIENARLFEQVRNGRERLQILSKKLVEVQEAERRRLAHELHDEIGQALTGLQFTLEMSKRLQNEALHETLAEAQEQISGLMNQVREMSIMLRPSILDDLGLLPALRWLFNRYQSQTGIQVHFTHQAIDRRFSPDIETTAFRITQEALTNIARYAGVKEVKVSAILDPDSTLSIQIQDQGRGFDAKLLQDSERSFGIAGMYERTNLAGGIFEIQTDPGHGTCITAIFPIDHPVERRRNERESTASG